MEPVLRNIFHVPYLFRNQASRAGLSLDHVQKPFSLFKISLGYFVIGSFSGQERPSSSDTGPIEWRTIVVFAVAVHVVPVPYRACPGLSSENLIYHFDRVEDSWVLG